MEEVNLGRVSVSLAQDVLYGIGRSKWCRAILVSGLGIAEVVVGSFLLTGSAPAAWMIVAAAASGYVLGLLIQLPFHRGAAQMKLELGSIVKKILSSYKPSLICSVAGKGKIYLGALPNRIGSEGEKIIQGGRLPENETADRILSIIEPWELKQNGPFACPYPQKYWQELGAENEVICSEDHQPLSIQDLHKAADKIHDWIEGGHNVYVHCLAGRARSAMAIAAYLLKYQSDLIPGGNGTIVDRVATMLLDQRAITLLRKPKKLERLRLFHSEIPK